MRFYLDENICKTFGISYYNKKEKMHSIPIASVLQLRNEWDDNHRSIMAGFIRGGIYTMKLKSKGYGWFSIVNYPAFINPPAEEE